MARDGGDQRGVQRLARFGEITIVAKGTSRTAPATIQDVSPTGMCLHTAERLGVDQIVRIESGLLSAVARVVTCRHPEASPRAASVVGVEFLTLDVADTRGTFVSRWS